MPLDQAFSLSPRESIMNSGAKHYARVYAHGASFYPRFSSTYRRSFDSQHTADELYFYPWSASDAAADYTVWANRRHAARLDLQYNLSAFEPYKEVALTFRFDAETESRILICTQDEVVDEEILHVGDNQFLIEIESTDSLNLHFIHVNLEGQPDGGAWYFRGIDGYIA